MSSTHNRFFCIGWRIAWDSETLKLASKTQLSYIRIGSVEIGFVYSNESILKHQACCSTQTPANNWTLTPYAWNSLLIELYYCAPGASIAGIAENNHARKCSTTASTLARRSLFLPTSSFIASVRAQNFATGDKNYGKTNVYFMFSTLLNILSNLSRHLNDYFINTLWSLLWWFRWRRIIIRGLQSSWVTPWARTGPT